jgi:hypothetical protein
MVGTSRRGFKKMKVRNWRKKCRDRRWWNEIIKQAKTHQGLKRQLKKKKISNALDGSEDDILCEESDASSENNHEDDFSASYHDFLGFYDE